MYQRCNEVKDYRCVPNRILTVLNTWYFEDTKCVHPEQCVKMLHIICTLKMVRKLCGTMDASYPQ